NYARKRSELARASGLGKKSAAKLSPSLQAVRSA
ncbi:MucR family transcriptional regulator, partial [Sinorhizobium meliloti]|nr:MucR family transcriptional regulator [Sinorhizobium meliloti]